MKTKLFFLFAITLFLTGNVFAQLINGVTYRFNGANTTTAGVTPVIPYLIGSGADNAVSPITDIGFDFWFAGTLYTKFSVTEDGLMKLGNSGDPAIIQEPVNSIGSSTNLPKIAPYWDDLATGNNGYVGYQLTGTAPSRILRVKWFVSIPKSTTAAANAMFQAELFEATGSIHFAYGTTYPPVNSAGYTVGLGVSATDWVNLAPTGNTFATVSYGITPYNSNTGAPAGGSVKRYQFGTDYTAPAYPSPTTIANTFGTGNRTLTARITDLTPYNGTGVPLTGNLVPRIYYKKIADVSWVSTPGVNQTGTGIDGTWLFTVDHSLLTGGVVGGDQIQYFLVAQDQSVALGHPNISSYPAGVVATEVNTITTPPLLPLFYLIGSDFSGTKTVGTGGDFSSLTLAGGLFDQINAGQLSGNLTVNIISDLTSETGAKGLNAWVNNGGTFTVTINPVGNRTISGATFNGGTANLIGVIGVTGFTIDGLNSGGNSLTITQTGQYLSGATVDLKGASGNTITNVSINNWANNSAISITNSTLPSNNNTISYCNISSNANDFNRGYGIKLTGTTSLGSNNIINNNTVTNFTYYHIYVDGKYTNTQISGNDVYNTIGTSWHNTYSAVNISTPTGGGITNVFNNKIHDILTQSNFSTGGIPAIYSNGVTGTTTNIYNNEINLDVAFNPLVTRYGIRTNGAGAVNIYYNSIYIGGTDVPEGNSYGLYRGGTGATNIKNNVVFNARSNSTGTGKHYGIYVTGITSLTSDYNDIFTSGTGGVFGFSVADKLTLTDWQIATSKDANSISSDPLFTSLTNFLPQAGSPLIGAAQTIANITDDITGLARDITSPTIGAYELNMIADKTLSLSSVLFEGLYNNNGTMRQASNGSGAQWETGIADHIIIELHDAANYSNILHTALEVPLSTTGIASVTIPTTLNASYYITVKHRNSVETTTATAISFAANNINKSFAALVDVYGGNLGHSIDGYYFIYGGDVNQDGIVDTGDMNGVDNGSTAILLGYNYTDVNGDGIVDTGDMNIVDNNSTAIITAKFPF